MSSPMEEGHDGAREDDYTITPNKEGKNTRNGKDGEFEGRRQRPIRKAVRTLGHRLLPIEVTVPSGRRAVERLHASGKNNLHLGEISNVRVLFRIRPTRTHATTKTQIKEARKMAPQQEDFGVT